MSYHIKARLGCVIFAGQILRDERDVSVNYINTALGVQRFVQEQSPYVSLVIRDQSGNDITERFIDSGVVFVKSRFQGGVDFVDMRKL